MSVQRRKIEKAIAAKGYEVIEIEWKPIGAMIEMVGRDGGWTVFATKPGVADEMACGYNADAVVAHIEEFWL